MATEKKTTAQKAATKKATAKKQVAKKAAKAVVKHIGLVKNLLECYLNNALLAVFNNCEILYITFVNKNLTN